MLAVIDCGTNTFNLIVVQPTEGTAFHYLYNDKIPVRLGEGGIDKKIISPAAFQRGISAMKTHKKTLGVYPGCKILAVGTAALRDASNGNTFIHECSRKTGIDIRLIDGDREAELIYKAARTCISPKGVFLVMDIGGGSNEFIIADNENIFWKKSYRLGVSLLKEKFGSHDYPPPEIIESIRAYVHEQLADLFEACSSFGVTELVGTAGSFDTYANVFSIMDTGHEFSYAQKHYTFNTGRLKEWCYQVPYMNREDRTAIRGIPDFRKEFMAYSCILTETVLKNAAITGSHLSTYSLKEGVIIEYLSGRF